MRGRDRSLSTCRRTLDETGGVLAKLVMGGVVLVALVMAAVVALQQGWAPDPRDESQARAPADGGRPPSGPGLALTAPAPAPAVLDGVTTSGGVQASALASTLGNAVDSPDLGRHVALVVEQLGSTRAPYAVGDPDVVPASTLKLLTSVAALQAMGPDQRFETKVVAGATHRSVVLVGGGDPLLTGATPTRSGAATAYPNRASLQELADKTATALRGRGVRSIRLAYDVSLFSGPAVNPRWERSYVPDDVVSPIVPLWMDEGRETDGFAARSVDASAEAARRFARFLDRAGVKVLGDPTERSAPRSAREIAVVESAPLAEIVQHVLELSDNEGAEILLRQTAIATGRPASFEGGVQAVEEQLRDLGIPTGRLTLYDGSGLSRKDALPVTVLTAVLQTAADPANPDLRSVVTTLPVAGFTGSLASRFVEDAPAGLGVVRAKTGTLSGIHGLAGIAVTRRGTPLLFAVVADRVPLVKTLDARAQLDQIAARLAACSC